MSPLYDFECIDCQQDFESYCPDFTENTTCPNCGSTNIDRLFSPSVYYRFGEIRESTTNKVSKDQANKSNPFDVAFSRKEQR